MNVTRQSVSKWENDQSLPDSEKVIRLSEIFGVTTDYLLKGKESDPGDLYSQHDSKAGAVMSAEVTEKLAHVHGMSNKKRIAIGICLFIGILLLIIFAVWGI